MVYHRLILSNDLAFYFFLAHRLVVITHAIVKNQVQERNHGELAAVNQERTARIRFLVFLFFPFPSVVVRSSKIGVFGMAAVGRGNNELERRGVIKTFPGAGESTRELRKCLGLCKATIHFGSQ